MICTICMTSIGECTCADRDEMLHQLAYDPDSQVTFKWCRKCDKHYARCRCEEPEFFAILRGKEQPQWAELVK